MSNNDRPPGANQVEVTVTVDIPDIGTFTPVYKYRIAPNEPKALTGEFTPPGITFWALTKAWRLFSSAKDKCMPPFQLVFSDAKPIYIFIILLPL